MAKNSYRGIPIKDRDVAHIRAALAGQDKYVADQFLALHDYARRKSLGLSRLSSETRIGTGILSPCFNGQYDKGDYNAIARRIETFFWRLDQKALYGGLREFKETALAKSLWAAFEKTRIIRRIQVIQGPEQVGKTRAAREYATRNNSGRTIYNMLSGGTKAGCGNFIWNTAEDLGLPYTVSLREKRLRIRQSLEACDLFFIDEAHLCFTWHDKAQRDFWDYIRTDIFADGARGVVIMATNQDMLQGLQAWRRRCGYNVGQLLGRMRNEIMVIDPAEDILLEDVQLLVQRYYKPGKKTLRRLHHIAIQPQLGHFGLITDVMNEAWTKAKSKKRKLDDNTVDQTAEETMKVLKDRKELYE